jgi:two-component system sensor histidine kinase CpxA
MRWPLSRKILLIALANLLLFAAVVAAFMLAQFRFGPESLLLGPAQDRILAIGHGFSLDLDATPEFQYDALFASYRQRYEAEFYLIDPEGGFLMGPSADLPDEVLNRIRRNRPPGRRPPRKEPPPRDPDPRKRPPPRPPPPARAPDPESVFLVISHSPTAYWAGARIPVSLREMAPGTPAILLIRADSLFNSKLFFDPRIGLGLVAALVAVAMLCWLPFIRGLTRSIAEMDRATQQIAEGRFDVKVATTRADELGHLGRQINRLSSRLESFVRNQKRFIGDIAHELCGPIARVQFALGILEQKMASEQQPHAATLHEEIQEMSALVNELLSFSKAGLAAGSVPLGPVDVRAVCARAVAREGAEVAMDVPEGLKVRAHEPFLVRAIANVVRNAVRYAGDAGPISISARKAGGEVEIRVADCGPGLPESELEQIFTPFYRPDEARTREKGGAGLGLAIVRSCIEACGGSVVCRNRDPHGLEVVMKLPVA